MAKIFLGSNLRLLYRSQMNLSLLSRSQAATTRKVIEKKLSAAFFISPRSYSSNNNAQQFEDAQKRLQTLQKSPGNDVKLKIYGLFKQATVGPVNTKRPGMTDFVGKAKWDAWDSFKSLTQDEAKQNYIELVDSLVVKSEPSADVSKPAKSSNADDKYKGFAISMDGKLKIIRFNKPEKKNALSTEMYQSFVQILQDAAHDPNVSIVAVTGSGNYFCSGNDLSNFSNFTGTMAEGAENGKKVLQSFVGSLIDFPKPIVAVVNGPAIGIACTILGLMDAVYASDRGWFQTPFSSLGQSPEACSSYTFPRIMGPAKANEMLMFNKKITTTEASKLGFVTEVYQDANLNAEVWPRLKELAELPVKSLVYSKELTRQFDRDHLHKVNAAECERLCERWLSDDCMEAIMKFFSNKSN